MQGFKRIKLGRPLTVALLEGVLALDGFFDRGARQSVVDALLVRHGHRNQLDVEIEAFPAKQHFDDARHRKWHVLSGKVKVADVEDAHRPPRPLGALYKLP